MHVRERNVFDRAAVDDTEKTELTHIEIVNRMPHTVERTRQADHACDVRNFRIIGSRSNIYAGRKIVFVQIQRLCVDVVTEHVVAALHGHIPAFISGRIRTCAEHSQIVCCFQNFARDNQLVGIDIPVLVDYGYKRFPCRHVQIFGKVDDVADNACVFNAFCTDKDFLRYGRACIVGKHRKLFVRIRFVQIVNRTRAVFYLIKRAELIRRNTRVYLCFVVCVFDFVRVVFQICRNRDLARRTHRVRFGCVFNLFVGCSHKRYRFEFEFIRRRFDLRVFALVRDIVRRLVILDDIIVAHRRIEHFRAVLRRELRRVCPNDSRALFFRVFKRYVRCRCGIDERAVGRAVAVGVPHLAIDIRFPTDTAVACTKTYRRARVHANRARNLARALCHRRNCRHAGTTEYNRHYRKKA